MEKLIDVCVTDLFNIDQSYLLLVKITAEIKKNRFMANVGPDSYESTLKNKS